MSSQRSWKQTGQKAKYQTEHGVGLINGQSSQKPMGMHLFRDIRCILDFGGPSGVRTQDYPVMSQGL